MTELCCIANAHPFPSPAFFDLPSHRVVRLLCFTFFQVPALEIPRGRLIVSSFADCPFSVYRRSFDWEILFFFFWENQPTTPSSFLFCFWESIPSHLGSSTPLHRRVKPNLALQSRSNQTKNRSEPTPHYSAIISSWEGPFLLPRTNSVDFLLCESFQPFRRPV